MQIGFNEDEIRAFLPLGYRKQELRSGHSKSRNKLRSMSNAKNYSYPLDLSWSTEELASVLSFSIKLKKPMKNKVEAKEYMEAYRAFKKVVPIEKKNVSDGSSKKWEWLFYSVTQAAKQKRGIWFSEE